MFLTVMEDIIRHRVSNPHVKLNGVATRSKLPEGKEDPNSGLSQHFRNFQNIFQQLKWKSHLT